MDEKQIEQVTNELLNSGFAGEQIVAGKPLESLSISYYPPTYKNYLRVSPIPQSAEISSRRYSQILTVVEVAKRNHIGLQIISSGLNIGYGSDAPYAENTILIDLSSFDKIYQYNKILGQISLEPGVTQQALYDYLVNAGEEHWPDSTGSPIHSSIIGNYLERGFGHSPIAEHAEQIVTMTCIVPRGSESTPTIVSTAVNGSFSSIAKRPHVVSIGPNFNGIFLQSNIGIVTNMTINVLPKPESFVAYFVEVNNQTFSKFIETCRYLKQHNVIQSAAHVGNYIKTLQLLAAEYPKIIGSYDADTLKNTAKQYGLSDWMMSGALYGTKYQVKANIKELKRYLKPLGLKPVFMNEQKQALLSKLNNFAQKPSVRKFVNSAITSPVAPLRFLASRLAMLKGFVSLCELKKGKPSNYFLNTIYWRNLDKLKHDQANDPGQDNVGCIWGAPCSPIEGEDVEAIINLINNKCDEHKFEPAISCTLLNKRNIECVLSISFDRNKPTEEANALQCYKETMLNCASAGYLKYRLSTHSNEYFDSQLLGTDLPILSLKNELDPLNIIQPGKYKIVSDFFTPLGTENKKNQQKQ
ncbi:FAD-binding protein [Alteromonas lipolytica]|uniref:FAD-binding PCMH-type domain-containing protein n=1 Tax=Alteromonas lipolytica TaxID=1856405 RepID=A0A1E8FDT7_9ALTE|nr:FAD-binding protein [Alteromonas lipolytica]OFI34081.1 hypothetical protein BFC17_21265 [Alteromonas lipolytica]GGF65579.1 4-cresol dehydrogenase [Alteromonas lipolytica]